MSDIIRTIAAAWTPTPSGSLDTHPHKANDPYRFTQNQLESAERQNQRAVDRTIRATSINATPHVGERRSFTVTPWPNALITLIIP
jgi:hypothetical protein